MNMATRIATAERRAQKALPIDLPVGQSKSMTIVIHTPKAAAVENKCAITNTVNIAISAEVLHSDKGAQYTASATAKLPASACAKPPACPPNQARPGGGCCDPGLVWNGKQCAPPKPVPVDLRALVDESAIDADAMRHPGIAYRNDVPDDVTIRVDPEQLARVLVNLLKNAREAIEAAGDSIESPSIAVSFAAAPDGLVLAVADNGPGLPPRARDNLFVAFEGSAKAGGTGLGLAIARELVAAHGGTLSYIPLDPGTRFDIRLPASLRLA